MSWSPSTWWLDRTAEPQGQQLEVLYANMERASL